MSSPFVLDPRNILSLVAAVLVASLAASAGVGGGAFFVPLFMVCVGFGLKTATGLSQAVIAAVSLASICFNVRKRHPQHPDQPLINFPMCLVMTPALLFGVISGVLFNAAAPTWLITALLVSLLAFMCRRTTQKGLQQWSKESEQLRQQHQAAAQQQAAAAAEVGGAHTLPVSSGSSSSLVGTQGEPAAQVVIGDSLESKGRSDGYTFPWLQLLGVGAVWVGFAALQVLKDQQQKCSAPYFQVFAAQLVFAALCTAVSVYTYFGRQQPRATAEGGVDGRLQDPLLPAAGAPSSGSGSSSAGYNMSLGHVLCMVALVALAGMTAGVVGIGGGLLMGPMLLDLGVHPQAATATSNILVFMCSSAAALAFLLSGRLETNYAAVFCSACGMASIVGLTVVGRLIKATGHPSVVVLLLAFIMGAGGLVSGILGFLDAWQKHQAGGGTDGFKSLC